MPSYIVTSVGNVMEIMLTETDMTQANASVIRIQRTAVNLTQSVTYLGLQTQVLDEQPLIYDSGSLWSCLNQ